MRDGDDPATSLGAFGVLSATTLTLLITTWGTLVYTTVSPIIAAEFGVSPVAIGYQVGLAYLSAMLCSLYSGDVTLTLGARATLIAAMGLTATGSLVSTLFSIYGLFLGTVLLGLAHGLVNPAAAILLARTGREGRRSLLFSIRQSGTPLGGLTLALVSPTLAEHFGWRAAGYVLAGCAVAIGVSTWLAGRHWGTPGRRGRHRFSANPFAAVLVVVRSPILRALAFVAMCYAGVQVCMVAFLTPFLVEDLSLSLILAGGLVAAAQASGGIGRPFWGFVADATSNNLAVLGLVGIVAAICAFAMSGLSEGTSLWLIYGLAIAFGATAIGWNGVFAAEVVRVSPQAEMSYAMAGSSFFTFAAAVVLPAAFALVNGIIDSYSVTIAALGAVSFVGSVAAFRQKRRARQGNIT